MDGISFCYVIWMISYLNLDIISQHQHQLKLLGYISLCPQINEKEIDRYMEPAVVDLRRHFIERFKILANCIARLRCLVQCIFSLYCKFRYGCHVECEFKWTPLKLLNPYPTSQPLRGYILWLKYSLWLTY